MKLTAKQKEALEWLSNEPWVAPWWGGKPHAGWPKEMPAQTYNSLSLAKLVRSAPAERLDKMVEITQAGRDALATGSR